MFFVFYGHDGFVSRGIEGRSFRGDLLHPRLLQFLQELLADHLETLGEGSGLLGGLRSLEGPFDVVEDGQQLGDQRFTRVFYQCGELAAGAFLVIVELGGQPYQAVLV